MHDFNTLNLLKLSLPNNVDSRTSIASAAADAEATEDCESIIARGWIAADTIRQTLRIAIVTIMIS